MTMRHNPVVSKAATSLCNSWLKHRCSTDEATQQLLTNFNLSADERQEAEDLAQEWYDDEIRDMPERIAHMESQQTEPVCAHGPWGSP